MWIFSLLLTFGFSNNMAPGLSVFEVSNTITENSSVLSEKKNLEERILNEFIVNTDSITVSYANSIIDAGQLRLRLKEELRLGTITLDYIKTAFANHLVDDIIPHWYGTPWSFGGHTEQPNQGKIACGYFVSTTLRDMGLQINRYKLAQKSPVDEAKMISCGAVINNIVKDTAEKAFVEIDSLTSEGLYFIGFDEGHVGYLLKRKGELFLIHSNYLAPVSVCMETLKESRVFKRFSKFHLVSISHNETLLQRWLDEGMVL